jgi:outer membrane protein assembly factor BamB
MVAMLGLLATGAGGVAQEAACVAPTIGTVPALPAGGASGSVAQPGPAPEAPQACWTWSMDAYTMNADANEIVAVGDTIVTVAHDPELVALDAATGTERWRYPTSEEDYATVHGLAAAEGVVYAGGMEGLDAIDVTDGTLAWRYEVENTESPNPAWGGFFDPAVVGGSVYGTTRVDAADGTSSYSLVALDAASGTPRWSVPISTEGADPVATDGATVALTYITLVDGVRWPDLGAFDAATGSPLWVHEIRDVERWPSTRTILTDSLVHLGSQNGDVIALSSADGAGAWRHSVGYTSEAMTAGNGMLFVISGGEIHALSATSGKERWHKAPRSPYYLASETVPAVVDGGPLIMFGASNDASGQLVALDPRTGKQQWRTDAGASAADPGSPIVTGGRVVLTLGSSEVATVMSFGTP